MKKFILKIIFWGMLCTIMCLFVSFWIDPYNVFHYDNIRDNGIDRNSNYIKMKYLLDNPDKFDSYVFGSSRVGSIHVEKIKEDNCYNMTYSMGTPFNNLNNIKTMLDNGIRVEKIYLGVDSYSYTLNGRKFDEDPMLCPYEQSVNHKIDFWKLYINPPMVLKSIPQLIKNNKQSFNKDAFYNYGWWCDYDRETSIDWSGKLSPYVGEYDGLMETIGDIEKIIEICNKNQIELVVFTNPMHSLTYEKSLECDYILFLKKLAEITDYYNFSGLNDITTNNSYYIDTSHYNAYVGDMIIDTICGGKVNQTLKQQGFGYYVTQKNIDELIGILEQNE